MKRGVNAHRAPGPAGVFVEDLLTWEARRPQIWRWEGWPANENDERARRHDLDGYYRQMQQGQVLR